MHLSEEAFFKTSLTFLTVWLTWLPEGQPPTKNGLIRRLLCTSEVPVNTCISSAGWSDQWICFMPSSDTTFKVGGLLCCSNYMTCCLVIRRVAVFFRWNYTANISQRHGKMTSKWFHSIWFRNTGEETNIVWTTRLAARVLWLAVAVANLSEYLYADIYPARDVSASTVVSVKCLHITIRD